MKNGGLRGILYFLKNSKISRKLLCLSLVMVILLTTGFGPVNMIGFDKTSENIAEDRYEEEIKENSEKSEERENENNAEEIENNENFQKSGDIQPESDNSGLSSENDLKTEVRELKCVKDDALVTVSTEKGDFDKETRLEVEDLKSREKKKIKEIIEESLGEKEAVKEIYGYDIKVMENGTVYSDGKVALRIEFSERLKKSDKKSRWKLYHISDDNNVEDITDRDHTEISGNSSVKSVKFETVSFSKFILAEVDGKDNEKTKHNEYITEKIYTDSKKDNRTDIREKHDETDGFIKHDEVVENVEKENERLLGTETVYTPLMKAFQAGSDINSLENYITDIKLQKFNEIKWIDADSFSIGDISRINIDYKINADAIEKIRENGKKVYYYIPSELSITQQQDGVIKNGNKEVGTYSIYPGGKAVLDFYEDFLEENLSITGTLMFAGKIEGDGSGKSGIVIFPGSSVNIKYTPPVISEDKDIKIKKDSAISEDKSYIDYTLTVSSEKGTPDKVRITDYLYDVSKFSEGISDIKIDGHEIEDISKYYSGASARYEYDGKKIRIFDISDLPGLGPGESYKVTYRLYIKDIYGKEDVNVMNACYVNSGPIEDRDSNSINWNKNIKKYLLYYNEYERLIDWEIDLNRNCEKTSGTLSDRIEGELKKLTITSYDKEGRYKDEKTFEPDGNGNINGVFANSYINYHENQLNFHLNDTEDRYYIKYSVKAPENITSVTNTADFNGISDSATAQTVRKRYISKINRGLEFNNGERAKAEWDVIFRFDEGDTVESLSEGFTLTDEIKNLIVNDKKTLKNSHFADYRELKKSIEDKFDIFDQDNVSIKEMFDIDVRFYDGHKKNNETAVNPKCFEIKAKVKERYKDSRRKLKYLTLLDYSTYGKADISELKNGDEIKFRNKISMKLSNNEEIYSYTAEAVEIYKDKLDKLSYKRTEDGREIFNSDVKDTVNYDENNGSIKYKIYVRTDSRKKCDETYPSIERECPQSFNIEDVLPEGVIFKKDSVKYNIASSDRRYEYELDDSITKKCEENGNRVNFTIGNLYHDTNYPFIAITYEVEIADKDSWNTMGSKEEKFVNRVTYDNSTKENTTVVKKQLPVLEKKGEQIKDGNDRMTNGVKYTVKINPEGHDLVPHSNKITLSDKMGDNAANFNPKLDVNRIRLYSYDAETGRRGSEIDKDLYSVIWDQKNLEFKVELDDGKAYILEYIYELDNNLGNNTEIKNSANINGSWSVEDKSVLKELNSSATATHNAVTFIKVDSKNYNKILPGTKFTLQYLSDESENGRYKWKKWEKPQNSKLIYDESRSEITVDSEGRIRFDLTSDNIKKDTLYMLTETEAAEGYRKSDEPVFFVVKSNGSDDYSAYLKTKIWNASYYDAFGNRIGKNMNDRNAIDRYFESKGGISYITNEFTELKITKKWQDYKGNQIDDDKNLPEITVKLKNNDDENTEDIVLNRENGWTAVKTVDNTKKYTVEEVKVAGYTASYINNDGINNGEIIVINRKDKGYSLPITGGAGLNLIYSMGAGMTLLSAVLIFTGAMRKFQWIFTSLWGSLNKILK